MNIFSFYFCFQYACCSFVSTYFGVCSVGSLSNAFFTRFEKSFQVSAIAKSKTTIKLIKNFSLVFSFRISVHLYFIQIAGFNQLHLMFL